MSSSQYLETERKEYALYTLQARAIPAITDGLKSSARRVLWIARDGKKYKTTTLAGATMPIHPHGPPEGTINTLAAPYSNNIPLLTGDGAFGTLLDPSAFGAGRYTSVKISTFTEDVMFRDIEIIPMIDNYDGSQQEPKHFLPLIPVVLLNPQEGIAVGFASDILPRSLENIVMSQIQYLQEKKVDDVPPYFMPQRMEAIRSEPDKTGNTRWIFLGRCSVKDSSTLCITELPYGITHEKFVDHLTTLIEHEEIIEFIDESKDKYNIIVKFKRGTLSSKNLDKVKKQLKLITQPTENMTVIDFDGERVLVTDYVSIIKQFTEWRLGWYKERYLRLANLLCIDIDKYTDILIAIKYNIGSVARKTNSRTELKEYLKEICVKNLDYIIELSIYRLTEEERQKIERRLIEARDQLVLYEDLIKFEDKRKEVYINELKEILKIKYNELCIQKN